MNSRLEPRQVVAGEPVEQLAVLRPGRRLRRPARSSRPGTRCGSRSSAGSPAGRPLLLLVLGVSIRLVQSPPASLSGCRRLARVRLVEPSRQRSAIAATTASRVAPPVVGEQPARVGEGLLRRCVPHGAAPARRSSAVIQPRPRPPSIRRRRASCCRGQRRAARRTSARIASSSACTVVDLATTAAPVELAEAVVAPAAAERRRSRPGPAMRACSAVDRLDQRGPAPACRRSSRAPPREQRVDLAPRWSSRARSGERSSMPVAVVLLVPLAVLDLPGPGDRARCRAGTRRRRVDADVVEPARQLGVQPGGERGVRLDLQACRTSELVAGPPDRRRRAVPAGPARGSRPAGRRGGVGRPSADTRRSARPAPAARGRSRAAPARSRPPTRCASARTWSSSPANGSWSSRQGRGRPPAGAHARASGRRMLIAAAAGCAARPRPPGRPRCRSRSWRPAARRPRVLARRPLAVEIGPRRRATCSCAVGELRRVGGQAGSPASREHGR